MILKIHRYFSHDIIMDCDSVTLTSAYGIMLKNLPEELPVVSVDNYGILFNHHVRGVKIELFERTYDKTKREEFLSKLESQILKSMNE